MVVNSGFPAKEMIVDMIVNILDLGRHESIVSMAMEHQNKIIH